MKLSRFCRPFIIALPLLAVSMPNAFGTLQSCSSYTTLQQYIGLGSTGCLLGDKTVSDFAFLFQGGTSADGYTAPIVPPASAVTVTDTLADTSKEPAWVSLTFNFNGDASVTANQTMDLIIQYVVATPPLATITEATMSGLAASRKQSTTATSSAQLIGSICLGTGFDVSGTAPTGACEGDGTDTPLNSTLRGTTTSNSLSPNVVANQTTRSGSATSLSQTQVGVYDEIKLFGGSTNTPSNGSQAAASTVTQTFYESYAPGYGATPEPVPVLLVGFALVGLSLGRRQKRG